MFLLLVKGSRTLVYCMPELYAVSFMFNYVPDSHSSSICENANIFYVPEFILVVLKADNFEHLLLDAF